MSMVAITSASSAAASQRGQAHILFGMNPDQPCLELGETGSLRIYHDRWPRIAMLEGLHLGVRIDHEKQQAVAIPAFWQLRLEFGPDAVSPGDPAVRGLVRKEVIHHKLLHANDDAWQVV
jgi:hypothetical protein